ncbi:hypothetical protein GGI10_003850 [Coemansia sp. RSA 2530]|nr:hypothetical protein GGI10_003850 [Coemansia sp. RSA 2530]
MFRLTTSAGNSLEQPIRPGERFAGVVALDIPRPMQASQVVLEFTATERWLPGNRVTATNTPGTKFVNSTMLSASLVVWKAQQKGVTASTVLSDGMHVFNFSCQIPHLNYPQSIRRAEYEVVYMLEGKVLAPKDHGDEQVIAVVEKELYFSPLVAYRPSADLPLSMAETLCFEKKGRKGKPAIELRALLSSRQIIAGSKLKVELSIKELTSSSWTKIVARLFERTVCRDESTTREPPAAPPLWSTECELANTELVRSSVYNFFLSEDITGSKANEKKTASGETVTSELLVFPIPMIPCSPLDSEHLDFLHYISLEVYLPGWLSSDRFVHIEFPVQLVTCEQSTALPPQGHQTPIAGPDRSKPTEGDEFSIMSGKSGNSARPLSTRSAMTAHSIPIVLGALPPRYCDVQQSQRPPPTLQLVKQVNASNASTYDGSSASIPDLQLPRRLSRQSQSNSHRTTMSSAHSMDMKSLMVGLGIAEEKGEERYRSRPLPMAPVPEQDIPAPPPLPAAPMPSDSAVSLARPPLSGSRAASPLQSPRSDLAHYSFLQSYPKGSALPGSEPPSPTTPTIRYGQSAGNPATSMSSDTSSPGTYARKQRQSSVGSTGASDSSHLKTPISPAYNESMNVGGADSDDDAGYFKSSIARKSLEREKVSEKGLFRLRKNSSIKHIG